MIEHRHKVRVRYGECDSMGFVHHSVYALYYEEARTELMRTVGLTYKEFEDSGIIMPVKSMHIDFSKAALYDDVISIEVKLEKITGVRCWFAYKSYNQNNILLNTGSTVLFFADKQTYKPIKLPPGLIELLNKPNGSL